MQKTGYNVVGGFDSCRRTTPPPGIRRLVDSLLCRVELSGSSGQTASPDSSLDIISAASSLLDVSGV